MCFSYKSSMISWMIAFLSSMYMLIRSDVYDSWLPLFILTFTQIQIMESVIWAAKDNKQVNSHATKMIMFLLWLQPLLNSAIGYYKTNSSLLFYMIFIFTLIIIYESFASQTDTFDSSVGPNGHLIWNRYDKNNQNKSILGNLGIIYLIGLLLPFFFMKDKSSKVVAISFAAITFFVNYFKYDITGEFSSMWCYSAAVLSCVTLLLKSK